MNNVDRYNLKKVILNEYSQIKDGLKLSENISFDRKFKSITVSGMGGSALPADVLKMILKTKEKNKYFRININRDYKLPTEAYDNSLNIICSYSGNTEETISSFNDAIDNNLPCIAISHGGKIKNMAEENDIRHVEIPYPFDNFQPRMATGYFVFIIWKILDNLGIVDNKYDFDKISDKLKNNIREMEDYGKKIAEKLVGKTPVIYSTSKLRALAMIWKIKLNENSKTPAFWNYFPEVNHNEMVGYTNSQADFFFISLQDSSGYVQNIKRMNIMKKLMNEKGNDMEIVNVVGDTLVEKVFSALYLGDWVSYYLALKYGIDPTPVEMVEKFKKMIA